MIASPVSVVRLAAKDFSTKLLLPRATSLWSLFCTALIRLGISGEVGASRPVLMESDLKRYSPHVQYKIPGFQEAGVEGAGPRTVHLDFFQS